MGLLTYPHTSHNQSNWGITLTSSLRPILWGSVSEPIQGYRVGSDVICNDPRKNASHICAIPQKDLSQLRLFVIVNKTQIYLVNTRCKTHYIPTHITQSIKFGHHNYNWFDNSRIYLEFLPWIFSLWGERVFYINIWVLCMIAIWDW